MRADDTLVFRTHPEVETTPNRSVWIQKTCVAGVTHHKNLTFVFCSSKYYFENEIPAWGYKVYIYIYILNHYSGSKNMVPAPVLTVTTFFCLGSISWGHVTRAETSKHKADSTFDVVLLMEEILHLSMIW